MTAYLDTSVVVPLFLDDDHSPKARAWANAGRHVALSAWTVTEFSSALSHQVRMDRITASERVGLERVFDGWVGKGRMIDFKADRFNEARRLLQRHARLRAPDALHLAIARHEGLPLATLDDDMREAAVFEGMEVIEL